MVTHLQHIATLQHLLDYDLRKLAVGELQLKNTLPEWLLLTHAEKLKMVIKRYQDITAQHFAKISSAINSGEILPAVLASHIIKGIIEEANILFNKCSDAEVKDAAILAIIQQINHYKICAYGTVSAYAAILGMDNEAAFFKEAEINEKQIDDRLSQLAAFEINSKAKSPIV